MAKDKKIKVKLIRGLAGKSYMEKRVISSLGLRKPNQVKEHTDSPSFRGMVKRVRHLIEVTE